MGKALPIEEKEFVNEWDQKINPGDEVIVVTTGYGHNVSINKAKYLGYRNRPSYYNSIRTDQYVVIEYLLERNTLVHKDTGEEWNYSEFDKLHPYPSSNYAFRYGTPEWNTDQERVRKAYKDRDVARQESQKDYISVKKPYTKKSQLQRNRIFPIHSALETLTKVF